MRINTMFSQYYIANALHNNLSLYDIYCNKLSSAMNVNELTDLYAIQLSQLDVEKDFKKNKSALDKAYASAYSSILIAQWNHEYLTSFRLCLVSTEKLYQAFKSTGNLVNTITVENFKNALYRFDYNQQVDIEILNNKDRPTSIKIAVNFYSIPASLIEYYDQIIMEFPEKSEIYQAQQKGFYLKFEKLAQAEWDIFYRQFDKNVSNYLYFLMTKNIPDAITILKSASISRDDLIELNGRIKCPSTLCNHKNDICQAAEDMIAKMPETKSDDTQNIVVKLIKRQNK
jgi:hypothetical protein